MDRNAILVAAMKNRSAGKMMHAYQELVDHLQNARIQPKLHLLDNKRFTKFKEIKKSNDMKHQLVPPHDHRRNIAETTIKVFKAHFISILCGCDKSFPLFLMVQSASSDRTHAKHAPNFTMTPYLSPYAYLLGQHDYNQTLVVLDHWFSNCILARGVGTPQVCQS